ncbi:PadR family transcriptional regulator [Nocardioides plantarum]|uniref:PadR family transcriptional regulator n=1 Tax=Nocardioides plantarum TaxID=29299 RepID=A0ABV5KHS8_9ACTN|nr:PadR family transcriptional regulator [Nocardioides plantarum]
MGHRGHQRHWAGGPDDNPWQQHGGGRRGGWEGPGRGGPMGGRGGPMGGPPPWVAGLFGLGQPERGRGPRVRRGDVRMAILDVLATAAREGEGGESVNGYQVIQQIAERSDGGWRPSPGSVYPTIQQLQDEGLVDTDDERGRRSLRLTESGQAYVADHADELAAVWLPFERSTEKAAGRTEQVDLKSELGQVMPAVWQIVTQGSEAQRRAALDILVDTRRKLYGVLADGPEAVDPATDEDDEA